MSKYIFKRNSKETLRWHTELGKGDNFEKYFEYLWFDAVFDDGHYLRVAPFAPHVTGSHGVTEGGTPTYGYDLLLPDGRVFDETVIFKPEEFVPADFGGTWREDNILIGTLDEHGDILSYSLKFDLGGVAVDIIAEPIAQGIQYVKADHGYSYFNPTNNTAMGWWPMVPRSNVKGTITYEGKTVEVSGVAYLDKQVGNTPKPFGGMGQAWWTWGHFFCGEYTATFTDSAATEHYGLRHFSPLVLWKGGEIVLATYDFVCYVEQYDFDEQSGLLYPKVLSMRASDGSVLVETQIKGGTLTEPETPSLGFLNYIRQFKDINMQIYRYGELQENISGKIIIEYGAGEDYMPWSHLK